MLQLVASPSQLEAIFWGLFSGSALLLGAIIGYFRTLSQAVVGGIMAFGAGVLIAAFAFELMEKAEAVGGYVSVSIGFLLGALLYSLVNNYLSERGAEHRKKSDESQSLEVHKDENGIILAFGALLDGIPESIAIGIAITQGSNIGKVTIIAIFLSNIPEGLSSSAGMKRAGRSKYFVFGLWTVIMTISGLAAWLGFTVLSQFSEQVNAGISAFAAGAIISMLSITMMPEAYNDTQKYTGILTALGFLAAFILSRSI